jgi:hypothetical protein
VSNDDDHYRFVRQYAPTLQARNTEDAFGRETITWVDDKTLPVKEQTVYASGAKNLITSYENQSVKVEKILEDLGEEAVSKIQVYEDGTPVEDELDTDTEFGGRGSTIEVYAHTATAEGDTAEYRVIVINTYAGKAVQGSDAKKTITVDGMKVSDTSIAKDDIVLYTKAGSKIQSTEVLEGTKGVVTATGSTGAGPAKEDYIRIDGVQKYASKNATLLDEDENDVDPITSIASATFYYDDFGNIIYAANVGPITKDVDGYAWVVSANSKAADEGNLLDASTEAQAKVKIVDLTTGAVSVVNQGIVVDGPTTYYANKFGGKNSDATVGTDNNYTGVIATEELANQAAFAGYYGYYVLDDGSYVFEEVADAVVAKGVAVAGTVTSDTVTDKGVATVGISGVYADSATVLTVISGEHDKYTAVSYTGIANFPKIEADSEGLAVLVTYKGTKAVSVVVFGGEAEATAKTYGAYVGVGETDVTNGIYTHIFYVNDNEVTYSTTDGDASFEEGVVYTIETTPKGDLDVDSTAAVTNTVEGTVVTDSDTYIVVSDNADPIYKADGVQTYDISKDKEGIKKDATVTVYTDTVGEKTVAVYIVVSDPEEDDE